MNNHLKEFEQKKEANILSQSAYYNLLYNTRTTPNIRKDAPKISIIVQRTIDLSDYPN